MSLLTVFISLYGETDADSSMAMQILGIFLVFIAQFIQSSQTVIEEYLLQGIQIDSELVVGLEGLWGLIMTGCIFIPIAQYIPGEEGKSLHEDTIDSFYMCIHSLPILLINLAVIVCLLFLNFGSMNITFVKEILIFSTVTVLQGQY